MNKLIFERTMEGRRCVEIPSLDVSEHKLDSNLKRQSNTNLPEVAEIDLVRHYVNLSKKAFGVDNGFYPLGSCTMKYNPKINEDIAKMPEFTNIHPLQPEHTAQGSLEVMSKASDYLCEITGMDQFTMQPAAGAHGELTGLMMIKAYHEHNGNTERNEVIIPDSGHGTNPATASMCGYKVITVPSKEDGNVDVEKLRELASEKTVALMLTNPNTVGRFEKDILEMSKIIHDVGGLLYYDGANLNAIMGVARPGDMGFDVVHLNLHKTMSTPHGGGGPGSGAVGCKNILKPFLPNPTVVEKDGKFEYQNSETSIGKVRSFNGNFGVYIKALSYIMSLGAKGIREASQNAVLNANYMLEKLSVKYDAPFPKPCMHEFVLSLAGLKKETGVSALDISKNLLDNGIHPPTMYFPLIVEEALMFEPTETESRETLDKAIDVMLRLHEESYSNPEKMHEAPVTMSVRRLDEVTAARSPILKFE